MARIKGVLNERRLAYEGAVRIFAERQEALMSELHAMESAEKKEQEQIKERAQKAEEKAQREARAVPDAVKLAEQGLFESVPQEQIVRP